MRWLRKEIIIRWIWHYFANIRTSSLSVRNKLTHTTCAESQSTLTSGWTTFAMTIVHIHTNTRTTTVFCLAFVFVQHGKEIQNWTFWEKHEQKMQLFNLSNCNCNSTSLNRMQRTFSVSQTGFLTVILQQHIVIRCDCILFGLSRFVLRQCTPNIIGSHARRRFARNSDALHFQCANENPQQRPIHTFKHDSFGTETHFYNSHNNERTHSSIATLINFSYNLTDFPRAKSVSRAIATLLTKYCPMSSSMHCFALSKWIRLQWIENSDSYH